MKPQDIAKLLILAAIWGSSFIFMRIISPILGPAVTASFRILIAGVALAGYFAIIKFDPEWKTNLKHYIIIGALNAGLPFLLFAFAALHIPAGYSAILNSTAPLFGAVFSALWLSDKLTNRRLLGLILGALGVGLVSRVGGAQMDALFGLSVLACLMASMSYALASIYIKKYSSHVKPLGIAGGSQLMGGLMLLPVIPFVPLRGEITPFVVFNLLALALMCSGLAFVIYYKLLANVGPTKALTVTFLIPIFGMIWGALFLHEPITAGMILGGGFVILGTNFVVRGKI